MLVPLGGLLLALLATGVVVLFQQRVAHDKAAQLTLASVENNLNQLQGLPWQAENRRYGSPAAIAQQMRASERGIERQLAGLLADAPPSSLRSADRLIAANFGALGPIYRMGLSPGGWNDVAKTNTAAQAQNATLGGAVRHLDEAGAVYAHRASVAEWTSRLSVLGAVLGLLAGFLFYFRRSEKTQRGLHLQARTDALTGLANRSAFGERVTESLDGLRAGGISVLFVDLDGFKDMNDLFGHRGGDAILREVAQRLQQHVGDGGLCARLGGDEFALVLETDDATAASAVAQRISGALREPMLIGGRTARVGGSIGVAVAPAGIDLETLTHWADLAMYAAKQQGNGRIELFETRLLSGEPSRVRFEQELGAAAQAGQLVVHYQPLVALSDGHCTGVEALVRWAHPERGLVPPDEFIPVAERTGAIIDIGAFVLERACADAVGWPESAYGPIDLHVNLSGRQLTDDHFIDTVESALERSGLAPGRLVLELTESTLLQAPGITEKLHALARTGVRIAIDDFGTGYASLTTLRSLPIDTVKIDRSFVARALESSTDRAVVSAIVQMAVRLGLHTVGEGVERADQQAFLKTSGAQSAQGFLYQRPVAADELARWLEQEARGAGGALVELRRQASA